MQTAVVEIGEIHMAHGQGMQGCMESDFSTAQTACADLIGESLEVAVARKSDGRSSGGEVRSWPP